MNRPPQPSSRRRIVVKIGSSSLTGEQSRLSREKLGLYADSVAACVAAGQEPILVSSGAVAAGFGPLGLPSRPTTLPAKQAAAAVGQGLLIAAYGEAFQRHGLAAAQILLTRKDFADRDSYRNALNTLEALLEARAVPVINENDTVAVEELNFGDNDMLAALVAALVHAELLVIVTDTNGLYESDPRAPGPTPPKRLDRVPEITPAIFAMAGGSGSKVGTGGMRSKVRAAQVAVSMGIQVFIGRVESPGQLEAALAGAGDGTYFEADSAALNRKKQWIAFHSEPAGAILIDDGAAEALLQRGKSLLPAGVSEVRGAWAAESVVTVMSRSERVLGKGICNYSAQNLARVLGRSSEFARNELGAERVEVIHRDSWAPIPTTDL